MVEWRAEAGWRDDFIVISREDDGEWVVRLRLLPSRTEQMLNEN